ncbi:HAD-IIB family hydrolase [Oleispirillum naphthae]|uniref:HAD-IIB family hydrolase n=1 Tax=Oleispirillum naphthae TaxID=2838853 RepID=UPI0030825AF2
MSLPLLLCCDLDRTLLPNGPQPDDPAALPRFRRVAARPEVSLAYVTGRSRALVERAMARWSLPPPDVVVADVGTTIYDVGPRGLWRAWEDWRAEIARDWRGRTPAEIAAALAGLAALTPQAEDRQGPFKLCYTAPPDADAAALTAAARARLDALGVSAEVVWSIDETGPIGLMDVLPARATKQGAVEFLMRKRGVPPQRVLFAGDSGNDLAALTGPFPAVLVANAAETVRAEARRLAHAAGKSDILYMARGDFLGMNGNYAAGILEGLAHFFPESAAWMDP